MGNPCPLTHCAVRYSVDYERCECFIQGGRIVLYVTWRKQCAKGTNPSRSDARRPWFDEAYCVAKRSFQSFCCNCPGFRPF